MVITYGTDEQSGELSSRISRSRVLSNFKFPGRGAFSFTAIL